MQVEQALVRRGERQQGLASARQLTADLSRSSLSRALLAGRVVRVRPRVYALAPLPALPPRLVTDDGPDPAFVARVRAALLSVHPSAACGRTAAVLHGWGLLVEPRRTIDLAVPHGVRVTTAPDLHVRPLRGLALRPLVAVPGTRPLAVSDPVTTVLRCCLDRPFVEAVVVADSALRARHVTLAELRAAAARLPGVRHAARVRSALDAADPLGGSVLESVFRCLLLQRGVHGWQSQVALRDRQGGHVLRTDFCWPAQRLVVELDGRRWHDPERDRVTANRLGALGWRVLRYTWGDVVRDGEVTLDQVVAALAARA